MRAFEYYTSTVFEVFDTDPANNRSLFGGGRYSNLVGLFSREHIPGLGFGMGDVTLFDFLDSHGLLPGPRSEIDVAVIPLDTNLESPARDVARRLRGAGHRVSTPLTHRKLGKELARADKAGADAVVIMGLQDWETATLAVRDLRTGEQETIAATDVVAAVQRIVGRQPAS